MENKILGLFFVALVILLSIASFDFEDYVSSQIREDPVGSMGFNREFVNWGELNPGDVVKRDIVIQNFQDVSCSLSLGFENCVPPEIEQYLDLSWSYDQEILSSGDWIQVDLFLELDPNVSEITFFSLDIVITSWS